MLGFDNDEFKELMRMYLTFTQTMKEEMCAHTVHLVGPH